MRIVDDESREKEDVLCMEVFSETAKKYKIRVRTDIVVFLNENSGGIPNRKYIVCNDNEYEVRRILSLNKDNKFYWIGKPLDYFAEETKGKMIPIGVDSGANYFCVNNENGSVFYWSSSDDEYYKIANNLEEFSKLFYE